MMMLGVLLIVAGVALALYSTVRKSPTAPVTEGDLGGINSFDAYYGKNRHKYGQTGPCPECEGTGCIGAGNCRCKCHKAAHAK